MVRTLVCGNLHDHAGALHLLHADAVRHEG